MNPRWRASTDIHPNRPQYYVPKNPFQTPSYYPQTPHAIVNTAGIFQQVDVETLFYVFYYHPGTYQQCVPSWSLTTFILHFLIHDGHGLDS